MSNEATVRAGLQIISGAINYQSRPEVYTADVDGRNGPVGGSIIVVGSGTGTTPTLVPPLTVPGFVRLTNLDTDNYVDFGLLVSAAFYPLGVLLPADSRKGPKPVVFLFSPDMDPTKFRLKARPATGTAVVSCNVLVEAFEA